MVDQQKLDALFMKARNAPHASVFHESKEQFLLSTAVIADDIASKKGYKITLKHGIIMILISAIIALTCLMALPEEKQENTKQEEAPTKIEQTYVKDKPEVLSDRKNDTFTGTTSPKEETQALIVMDTVKTESIIDSIKPEKVDSTPPPVQQDEGKNDPTSDFIFPKLTEEEISENEKRKKKMLKALNKKDKKVYGYVPSGSFTLNSNTTSVQAFHIQKTEVTNLEYKTFLFDLLIQGRKDDFLVAKPKQELWTEQLGAVYGHLEDNYFSGEEFEDYPVVNISRKGAEMYCDWITKETNKINRSNGDPLINDVRIPMRAEWLKAASVDGKFSEYAWENDISNVYYLSNFSMNGFDFPMEIDKKTQKSRFIGDSTSISTGGSLFRTDDVLVKSESYKVNDYGLYCTNGNVAEMVYDSSDSSELSSRSRLQPGTAGGGWMDSVDEIKFSAGDKYEGVIDEHLNIGFRVVITFFNPQKN